MLVGNTWHLNDSQAITDTEPNHFNANNNQGLDMGK